MIVPMMKAAALRQGVRLWKAFRVDITGVASGGTTQVGEWGFFLGATRTFADSVSLLAGHQTAAGEGEASANDGIITTKLCSNAIPTAVLFSFNSAKKITSYNWATGNDTASFPERNPYSWKVYGSHDGVTFALIDTKTAVAGLQTADYTWQSGWPIN
jgi:hypothetical protein